jgi:hypothetical protein
MLNPAYKVGFVFFADGSVTNKAASWRLYCQVRRSGIARAISCYNIPKVKHKLTTSDKIFINKNKKTRGYGFWLWKPLIILDFLEKNPELDFLIYLDVGCEFNVNKSSIDTLSDYLSKAETYGFVAFSTEIEKYWTKQSLIKYINPSKELLDSPQIQTGIIIFNTRIVREICEKWVEIMRHSNYSFLIDVPLNELNQEIYGFKEHRHDQSIFSVLAKENYSGQIYSNLEETYFPRNWHNNLDKPFFAVRNLRLTSILSPYFKILYHIENSVFKLFKYLRSFNQTEK